MNISHTNLSCSLRWLAFSSKPLDKNFSFSDTIKNVELTDIGGVFTTVICSFESLKKSNYMFSKCVNLLI